MMTNDNQPGLESATEPSMPERGDNPISDPGDAGHSDSPEVKQSELDNPLNTLRYERLGGNQDPSTDRHTMPETQRQHEHDDIIKGDGA